MVEKRAQQEDEAVDTEGARHGLEKPLRTGQKGIGPDQGGGCSCRLWFFPFIQ